VSGTQVAARRTARASKRPSPANQATIADRVAAWGRDSALARPALVALRVIGG
jgi:hypothetical protein